ncbi:hypothetical protein MUP79_10655 [Candidatus Bathyarchaeota archaeon]|nr:hypothetical protein [Candidatus Bathyarchaeota archaeon]
MRGSDGIGDSAVFFDAENLDRYPLMTPYVVPEFQPFMIMPLFMLATLLTVAVYKRKRS